MNNYEPYIESDLYEIINEPREVSDRPYMLHAAFLISCVFESLTFEEDDEHCGKQDMWGMKIPKSVLESIVKNANEQFVYASDNGTQIDVWNKPFSIRKRNAYDKGRLGEIFKFPSEDNSYVITKEGVMNLSGISKSKARAADRDEYQDNKEYLRKVVMIAEDDENDGWDKLTDMEVSIYCWVLYYRKHESDNEKDFRKKFGKDLYTEACDDRQCWNEVALLRGTPHGLYTYSAHKVRDWNISHGQVSIIDSVDSNKAEDYWYMSKK